MLRVIFNDTGEFLDELRQHFGGSNGDKVKHRPALRLTYLYRHAPADPFINVRVRAGVVWGEELFVLDLDCGSPIRMSPDLDTAKKQARAELETVRKAAEDLRLPVRGGVYEM